jgi:ribosomal protein L37E
MHLEKYESHLRWSQARQLVNEWDPIGVMPLGFPEDEYECMVEPLLRLLEAGKGTDDIAKYLASEGKNHFGMRFSGTHHVAYAVCARECGAREFIVDGQTQVCQHCGRLMFRTEVREYRLSE